MTDDLEQCVRDERWLNDWLFEFNGEYWHVVDIDDDDVASGRTALEAAQAALQTRGDK